MSDKLSLSIAQNLKRLREARQISQQRLSEASGVPRPTLAHLESGLANPTLSVLLKVSEALQVRLEQLWEEPVPTLVHYGPEALPKRQRGQVSVQSLSLAASRAATFERVELKVQGRWQVKPTKPEQRFYLYCEAGVVSLLVGDHGCDLRAGEAASLSSETGFCAQNSGRRSAVLFRMIAPPARGA